MNGKRSAERHDSSGKRYLKYAEERFSFVRKGRLYQPASWQTDLAATPNPHEQVVTQRPKGTAADWTVAAVGVFGLIVSGLTLIGLGLTVAFSIKQWDESHRTADASIVQASVAKDSLSEIIENDKRQLKESESNRREARISSDANAKQAAAALQETIESSHRQDQAWVGISEATPISYGWDKGGASMTVAFNLRNYGHSAAQHMRFNAILNSDPSVYSYSCDEAH